MAKKKRGRPARQHGESAKRSLFSTYKANAKRRRIGFGLTFDQFANLTSSPCYYCGALPAQEHTSSNARKGFKDTGSYFYNGIDRVNTKKGYEPRNVVPACRACNQAKGTLTLPQWLTHLYRLISNIQKITKE